MISDNMKLIKFRLKTLANELEKEAKFYENLFDKPTKELPKWEEEPFDDTKYIPIEFIRMVAKIYAQNEGYYNYIGEKELAEQEAHFAMCLHYLLRDWDENRPQWAEHITNVHTPTGKNK